MSLSVCPPLVRARSSGASGLRVELLSLDARRVNSLEHVERQAGDPRDRLIGQFELLERDDVPEGQVVDQLYASRVLFDRSADDVHGELPLLGDDGRRALSRLAASSRRANRKRSRRGWPYVAWSP